MKKICQQQSWESSSKEETGGERLSHLAGQLVQARSLASSPHSSQGDTARGEGQCSEHPGFVYEYWCKEDSVPVCVRCLIFSPHKGHTAITQEQRNLESRLKAPMTSLRAALTSLRRDKARVSSLGEQELLSLLAGMRERLERVFREQRERLTAELIDLEGRMEDCLEEMEEEPQGPDWTCPVEPSLVSSLLAEAGSLQVLPGCLEDRKGDILLTPPSLRLLARKEEGEDDDEVLAAGLQSLALEPQSVLVTAALSVAGSEASQPPAGSRVRSSEALQTPADPEPQSEPEVGQSRQNTDTRSIEGEQPKEHTEIMQFKFHTEAWQPQGNTKVQCDEVRQSREDDKDRTYQVNSKVRSSGVEQSRGDIEVRQVKPLDLDVASLAIVEVVGGDPRSFILRMADSGYRKRLDLALKQVGRVKPLQQPGRGQGVLLKRGVDWQRGSVLEVQEGGLLLLLVDEGREEEVGCWEVFELPAVLAAIPALTVACSLDTGEWREWDGQAVQDWSRLVDRGSLRISGLVDPGRNLVQLSLWDSGPGVVECLQFLGHLPRTSPSVAPVFLPEEHLAGPVLGCRDQHQPSPDLLLLLFQDSPSMERRLLALQELDGAEECWGPPGWVEEGSALLAPWQGGFYRAAVLARDGLILSLLFVDYGNEATADWWECRALPSSLLFPPIFTPVQLFSLQPLSTSSWGPALATLLRQVLVQPCCQVLARPGEGRGSLPCVEVLVPWEGEEWRLTDLLVHLGHARESVGGSGDCKEVEQDLVNWDKKEIKISEEIISKIEGLSLEEENQKNEEMASRQEPGLLQSMRDPSSQSTDEEDEMTSLLELDIPKEKAGVKVRVPQTEKSDQSSASSSLSVDS